MKISSTALYEHFIGKLERFLSKTPFLFFSILPGASQKVKFTITPDMMKTVNEEGSSVLNSGKIKVSICGSLPSKRSEVLVAAKSLEVIVNIQ